MARAVNESNYGARAQVQSSGGLCAGRDDARGQDRWVCLLDIGDIEGMYIGFDVRKALQQSRKARDFNREGVIGWWWCTADVIKMIMSDKGGNDAVAFSPND